MLSRLSTLTVLVLAGATGYVPAQIPARAQPLINRNAPYLLVATPHTARDADSAAAVTAGDGLRERITRNVGRDYRVITRKQMNDALSSFGYPADALLDFNAAQTLARKVSAPIMVMPTLAKADGGMYRLSARLVGTSVARGVAGQVVAVTQESGQKPGDLGEEVADALKPAFKAYDEAMQCFDNAATDQKKAIDAANKALKEVENFGPAEYCLGALAQAKDSTSEEALGHYQNAVKGDPQSVPSYQEMARIYFLRGDSAKVIATWQTILEVDPTDQQLRENAYKIFQVFGRPGAAEEVADAGIARDPGNPDWYDLKSNACLAQEKFSCAVDELERLYQVDSTRVDTAFYSKITYAAGLAQDTARYAKWAERGIMKYPDAPGLLNEANRAYNWTGNADGAIATARKLAELDPENMEPVQRTMAGLADAGKTEEVLSFLPMVQASTDPSLKNFFGQVLVTASQKEVQAGNLARADSLSQAALDGGMDNQQLQIFANYFISAHLAGEIQRLSQAVREPNATCDLVHEYQAVLNRAKPALAMASQSTNASIKNFTDQLIAPVDSEIREMNKAEPNVCK